jgi:hypothetical protein
MQKGDAVVLVSWAIDRDLVQQFKSDFQPVTAGTPGFIREDLYRLEDGPEDGTVRFLRVGRWKSEEAFYAALANLGVAPHTAPPQKPYERSKRQREWLAFVRDDTSPP